MFTYFIIQIWTVLSCSLFKTLLFLHIAACASGLLLPVHLSKLVALYLTRGHHLKHDFKNYLRHLQLECLAEVRANSIMMDRLILQMWAIAFAFSFILRLSQTEMIDLKREEPA